jgi:hypothetical protein
VLVVFAILGLSASTKADPVVSFVESFPSNNAGWVDRDGAEMEISFSAIGFPSNSISGSFSNEVPPVPDTDAVRILTNSSDGKFTGDYHSEFAIIAGWDFNFLARDVLPSSVFVRFKGNGGDFFQSVTDQIDSTGEWHSVETSLDNAGLWLGSTNASFSNALSNLECIDIQVTRTGADAQSYFIDNFTVDRLLSGGGDFIEPVNGDVTIVWSSLKSGVMYEVETATNLPTTNWVSLGYFTATNPSTAWVDVTATNTIKERYYRLRFETAF